MMKEFVLLATSLGLAVHCFAQEVKPNVLHRFSDSAPKMLDGSDYGPAVGAILHQTVNKSKLSPALRAQKRIYVNFIVDSVGNFRQGRGMLLNGNKVQGYVEDAEIKRAINALPRLAPGKKDGRDVSVSVVVPLY